MKPIIVYAAKTRDQTHLISTETGMSLCGAKTPRAKPTPIRGLEDVSCPSCRGRVTGLSVELTQPPTKQ